MGVKLRLEGRASLIHVLNPLPDCNTHEHRDEYYARIRADNGSIFGRRHPLDYDIPISKEQYKDLMEKTAANEETCRPTEYGCSSIEVVCDVELIPKVSGVDKDQTISVNK